MKLVFATNNKHKMEEIRKIIPSTIKIVGLKDIGCNDELPETGNTLEQNAFQKAHYVFDKYGYSCFADDSGLETEALNGRPGVYSARYASLSANYEFKRNTNEKGTANYETHRNTNDPSSAYSRQDADNIKKLLGEMNHEENRKARFRTVICLIITNPTKAVFFFDGSISGQLTTQPRGNNGFGYDPIFIPDGYHSTFAEMLPEMKSRISHRAEAVKKLAEYLESVESTL